MSVNTGMFSSESVEWETPQDLFDKLNNVFQFTLDVCATPENAKCSVYFTKEQDGLAQSWKGHRCFMNPPYGRDIKQWVRAAAISEALVVGLLPARTDTEWWHVWVAPYASVRFLRGRLKFGNAKTSAPFPSVIAVWWGFYV